MIRCPVHLVSGFVFCCLLGPVLLTGHISGVLAEEEEGFAGVLAESGLDPSLQALAGELFVHVHSMETSFRNLRWPEAAAAVDSIDLFYNKLLGMAEEKDVDINMDYLQAFEFSLAEIRHGIRRRDRALIERRFLDLQPELFNILDKMSTIPLRLTASRLYVDLAIQGVVNGRFDIARDELGEISEFMEQLEPQLAGEGYDMTRFRRLLVRGREAVAQKSPGSRAALVELRGELERFYRSCATVAGKTR